MLLEKDVLAFAVVSQARGDEQEQDLPSLLLEQHVDGDALPLRRYTPRPPHVDDDEVRLLEEGSVSVEEDFDHLRLEFVRPHCLPVGHPPCRLLDLDKSWFDVERPVHVLLLEPFGHLGVESWRHGVEERAKPSCPSLEFNRVS